MSLTDKDKQTIEKIVTKIVTKVVNEVVTATKTELQAEIRQVGVQVEASAKTLQSLVSLHDQQLRPHPTQ